VKTILVLALCLLLAASAQGSDTLETVLKGHGFNIEIRLQSDDCSATSNIEVWSIVHPETKIRAEVVIFTKPITNKPKYTVFWDAFWGFREGRTYCDYRMCNYRFQITQYWSLRGMKLHLERDHHNVLNFMKRGRGTDLSV
jgi:hypothetical protein